MLLHSRHYQRQDRERFAGTARTDLSYLALPGALAFRLLPYGLSVTSRSIGQPLADSALNRAGGALNVIYAEPNAVAISEIELRQIAVQMLLLAMLVDAFHAALEDRIVALNGVGRNIVADVFLGLVVHGVVAEKLAAQPAIQRGL